MSGTQAAIDALDSLQKFLDAGEMGLHNDAPRLTIVGHPKFRNASITWLGRSMTYRVFTPYPSNSGRQDRFDCMTWLEVHAYLMKGPRR